MENKAPHGIQFLETLDHYLASLVRTRDYAAAVKCYEDHSGELDAADGATAGSILRYAAEAYASLSNTPVALRTARLAQNMVAHNGDSELLAEIFLIIGKALRDLGEWREAEKAFRDAESIFRRKDCPEGQCRALNLLAGLFYRRGDYRNALSILMDAIEIAEKFHDRRKLAYMLGNIGRIETFIGEFRHAEQHLQTNIELSRELDDRTELARAQLALAYTCLQQDKHARADQLLAAAGEHLQAQGMRREEVIRLTYLGELRYRSGRLDDASDALGEALRLAEEVAPDSTLLAQVLRHLAELAVLRRRYSHAARYSNRAIAIVDRSGSDVEKGALWKIRAIVAEAADDREKGREYFLKAIDQLKQTGVRFEKAAALVAAGRSQLFSMRRRLTYLFRAEEFYRASGLTTRLNEVERIISELDATGGGSETAEPTRKRLTSRVVFLTENPVLKGYLAQIANATKTDLPLLLIGETGAGKDQMARYFHSVVRPDGPFVPVNCASIPETLLESELFGYRKGAFTGADSDKPGLFAAANGGMLYLDEIGDMPLVLQAKLLGVLERRRLTPLGATEEVDLDIKLVVATNRDLEAMVTSGAFRRDLFYRLSGITFCIPPLRRRKEDIPLLLRHFMKQRGLLRDGDCLPAELLHLFVEYDWPGNVRELENKVKQLEVMAGLVAEGDLVELTRSIFASVENKFEGSFFERVEQFERKMILEALLAARGNKSEAARMLGIHEATVRAKAKRFGIKVMPGGVALN
ncbi:MAG: sigma 54-interacting transcriptional regulator [Candidatus Zixiibacteriota bacterium]